MPNVSEEILIDALAIRDTTEHLSAEIPVGNAGYGAVSMFVESTLDQADVNVEVYVRRTGGEWCSTYFGHLYAQSNTPSMETFSGPFPWLRVGVTAGTAPTDGTITVVAALMPL